MIVIIKEGCCTKDELFVPGEVVSAPDPVAEFLIRKGWATVARNWRQVGEKIAPIPTPTRFL